MASLLDGFVDSVRRYPRQVALVLDNRRLTYEELALRASTIATAIDQASPGDSPLVGLLATESVSAYAGVLAILGAGRGFVPIDPTHPPKRILNIVAHSGVDTLVVGQEALDRLDGLLHEIGHPLEIIAPEADELRGVSARHQRHRFRCGADMPSPVELIDACDDPPGPAYLLYTSGSTDAPRGVAVTHRNACAYLDAMSQRLELAPDDRCSHTFPLSFDLSIHDLFMTWSAGATVVVWTSPTRTDPARYIDHHRLTSWFSVPTVAMTMERLGELRPHRFCSIRQTLFCGEPLPRSVAEAWRQAAPHSSILNLYGPTEATVAIAAYRFDPDDEPPDLQRRDIVSLGRLFDGQQALIVTGERRPLGPDTPGSGELWLSGTQVTDGYWRAPEATTQRFVRLHKDDERTWFRTGDRVERDAGGRLHFLGRLDDRIKVRGHHVELGEVDRALRRACGHPMAAAVGWPRSKTAVYGLVGLVATDKPLDRARVLARCRRHLPNSIVPDRIIGLGSLPTNGRGKIDRLAMQRLLQQQEI